MWWWNSGHLSHESFFLGVCPCLGGGSNDRACCILYTLYRSTNLFVVKMEVWLLAGATVVCFFDLSKKTKQNMYFSLHPRSNNKLANTNHFLKKKKKMLISIGSMFINFKPADGNLFSSHIYCDVSKVHFSFVCRLKQKQTEEWERGICAVKKDFSCFSMILQHVVSGSYFFAEANYYSNKNNKTLKNMYMYIYVFHWTLKTLWLKSDCVVLRSKFLPWTWMTLCSDRTAFSQGFWSSTDWDSGSTWHTTQNKLCEDVTYCIYLWKHPTMRTHTTHLHAQQGTDTGFRGITDSLKVMTPLQRQDHPTPSQWHQLTGEEAKTW